MAITGKKPSELDDITVAALKARLNIPDGALGGSSVITLQAKDADLTVVLPSDTSIDWITFEDIAASPIIKVGITPGGEEIIASTPIVGFSSFATTGIKYALPTTIYVSITGGTVNIRVDYRSQFFTVVTVPFVAVDSYSKADEDAALLLKADKTDVLRLSGATPNLQPASKSDIGMQLLWLGNIASNGTVTTIKGTLNVTCVNSATGVYDFTHDLGLTATDYLVLPGLGRSSTDRFASPRSCYNQAGNTFSIGCSDDGSGNNIPFQLLIYKI